MNRIVYEYEPFAATSEDRSQIQRLLGARARWDGHRIRIEGVCGQLPLPSGGGLIIRSRKADDASLLAWLAYGDPSLAALRCLGRLPHMADKEGFGSFIARVFCSETWRAIQTTGLLRSYHRQEVQSAVLRGRIDFARMARLGGDVAKTPCVVFSRLPQTPLNRLLSTAIHVLQRDTELAPASKCEIATLSVLFAEVPPLVSREELDRPKPLSRLELPFEASAALARLIIRRGGLSAGDTAPSIGFLVDLARLFESSVARSFRDSGLEVQVKHPVSVLRVDATCSSIDRHVPMEIDVLVTTASGERVVVDAKYKSAVSAANLQQVTTYCWLTGSRRAALVFPAGILNDRRSFELAAPDGMGSIRVDLLELELGGRDLFSWQQAGARLVDQLCGARSRAMH